MKEKNNWYVAEVIIRAHPVAKNKNKSRSLSSVWGNVHLVKASSISEAYDKAENIGKDQEHTFTSTNGQEMEWEYVGIGELVPLHDDVADGTELLWQDYGKKSAKRSESFVRTKSEWARLHRPKEAV